MVSVSLVTPGKTKEAAELFLTPFFGAASSPPLDLDLSFWNDSPLSPHDEISCGSTSSQGPRCPACETDLTACRTCEILNKVSNLTKSTNKPKPLLKVTAHTSVSI